MSVQLLDKTRKINKLLHNNNSSKVVFNDICAVLTEILDSNVLVVSRKGKILGVSKSPDVQEISELITEAVGSHIDQMLNERLLSILSTKENVNLETLGFSAEAVQGCQAIVTPIDIAGERLGTLFIYKQDKTYSIDDIILSEYGTAVVGLEMLRSVNEESSVEKFGVNADKFGDTSETQKKVSKTAQKIIDLVISDPSITADNMANKIGVTKRAIEKNIKSLRGMGILVHEGSDKAGYWRIIVKP